MIFGLGAALGWGLADFMVAIVSRRIGSFLTVVIAQLAGTVLFTVLLVLPGLSLPSLRPALAAIVLIGVLAALSYLAFYQALQLGPISLVTPIVSGYAAIVIVLALVFVGESLPPVALLGAAVTITGVVVASTDLRALRLPTRRESGGIFYALLAMAGFGLGAFLVGIYAKDLGWFASIYLSRLGSAAVLVALAATRRPALRDAALSLVPVAAFIGILDIFGFASFARGSELGLVSITAAASVTYPVIPILAGVMYLGEQPALGQWVGVALVSVGLLVLALGQ